MGVHGGYGYVWVAVLVGCIAKCNPVCGLICDKVVGVMETYLIQFQYSNESFKSKVVYPRTKSVRNN